MTRQGFIATIFAPLLAKLVPAKKEEKPIVVGHDLVNGSPYKNFGIVIPDPKPLKENSNYIKTFKQEDLGDGHKRFYFIATDPDLAKSLRNHPACKK
jgi:hypothetical protein